MSITYNPLLGSGFDFVGGSAAAGTLVKYSTTFLIGTFVLNGGFYEYTITQASHGAGLSPTTQVYELVGSNYELVQPVVIVNASGDIIIQVTNTPDLRFNGKIIVI